ncbi:MAG: AraC-like DNA-binding protein [bacterium]|jgi:AraC-like DNA-binding protein
MNKKMKNGSKTSSANWVYVIVHALENLGLDGRKLCKKAQINYEKLKNSELRIPQDYVSLLWKYAVEETQLESIGILVGKNIKLDALDIVGYSLMSSQTLRDSFERLARFQQIISEGVNIRLVSSEHKNYSSIVCQVSGDEIPTASQTFDATIATCVVVSRWLVQQTFCPIQVSFCHSQPSDLQAYQELFQCPLLFNQDKNEILISNDILDQPVPTANKTLARLHDQFLSQYLTQLYPENFSQQVKNQCVALLPSGEPLLDVIAEKLHLSSRTLQRRLSEEGHSFKALLDETRKELAVVYLERKSISLQEITFLLGFTESCNFYRAFKRWYGVPPGKYRESL